ncbi:MAG: hypothetical protein WBA74_21590 [Cyclobacteriaceae bacterium]
MKKLFVSIVLLTNTYLLTAQSWDTTTTGQITTTDKVGIGTSSPDSKLHVKYQTSGSSTSNSIATFEAADAHLDLISNQSGEWGSSLNLIEGNMTSNVNIWSIARRTSFGANSLRFMFGSNPLVEQNTSLMTLTANGELGIGLISPESKFHLQTTNVGYRSTNGLAAFEGVDAHIDVISGNGGSWGSAINFIEGDGNDNTNMWSIARKTTSSNADLEFTFGTSKNFSQNSPLMTLTSDGELGIGIVNPESKFHIQTSNVGYKSLGGMAVFEATDAHLDIISGDAGTWGSAINFIEGNGNNNTNMWSIARKTSTGASVLKFQFGNSNSFEQNNSKMTLTADGKLGIGSDIPESNLHIQAMNTGIKSAFGTAVIEAENAQIDIISDGAGDWGSAINFIEGNGTSNTNVWSLARRTFTGNSSLRFNFGTANAHNNQTMMSLNSDGSVGINTIATGTHKLAVNGSIGTEEIVVESPSSWADFVFADDYELQSLEEVESFIQQNNHLPEVPSEKEITNEGINLGEMDATLLQKIEELTLHMIEMNKRVKLLEAENAKLKAANK